MYICLQGWLRQKSPSTSESNGEVDLETLALLLKCMKIMENATFLSKDNQVKIKVKGSFFFLYFSFARYSQLTLALLLAVLILVLILCRLICLQLKESRTVKDAP